MPLGKGICLMPSFEALRILQDLAAKEGPSRLKATTPTPSRQLVRYEIDGRPYTGDLYLPGPAPRAGLLMIPGAAPLGKDDPRLVAFAETLARARFAVLVPDMPDVRELRVRPSDVRGVRDAMTYLLSQESLAPEGRAGMAGISYSVGPAILAALEPSLRERVRFILAVGGYYRVEDALTFAITGYYRDDAGNWKRGEPNPYGKWVYVLSNLDRVADPTDRERLREIAERKLEHPEAPISDLSAGLGPEGRQLMAFLSETDPERVMERIQELPAGLRHDMVGLDLSNRDFSGLRAQVILVHGKEDPVIPYTESVRLAEALPHARLYLVNGLMHVDFGKLSLMDIRVLGCAVDALLAERQAD